MANRIRRLIPALRVAGIEITPPDDSKWNPREKANKRIYKFFKISESCTEPDDEADMNDDEADVNYDNVDSDIFD